jgi:glycosyltransferase involved in cell wall biosynthesis
MNIVPEFSIIMPTYNRASLLPQCVDAVLAQTVKNFELIIVDDGSTDNTKVVLETFTDPRIKVLYQENTRQTQARRNACLLAQGRYLSFCDSDDIWHPKYLETLLHTFETTSADYVFTNYQVQGELKPRIDVTSDTTRAWLQKHAKQLDQHTYQFTDLYTALIDYQPIFCSCQSVRKQHYDAIGGIAENINNKTLGTRLTSEDSHIIRRSALTNNAIYIDENLLVLGRQGDNTSSCYISNLTGGLFILQDILAHTELTPTQQMLTKKAINQHIRQLCLQYYYHKDRHSFIQFYEQHLGLNLSWKSHLHYLKAKLVT